MGIQNTQDCHALKLFTLHGTEAFQGVTETYTIYHVWAGSEDHHPMVENQQIHVGFCHEQKQDHHGFPLESLGWINEPYHPRKQKTGNLPHILYLICKPQPHGTEFKCTTCMDTGCMLAMECKEGKMLCKRWELCQCFVCITMVQCLFLFWKKKYSKEWGATAACTLPLVEMASIAGQHAPNYGKKREVYCGDSWFTNYRTVELMSLKGYHFLGRSRQVTQKYLRIS